MLGVAAAAAAAAAVAVAVASVRASHPAGAVGDGLPGRLRRGYSREAPACRPRPDSFAR